MNAQHKEVTNMSFVNNSALIDALNKSLATTLDLKLQAKQAHWNVKGPQFIALHQLFDEIATAVEGHVDLLAERIMQLDGIADGTVQAVSSASSLTQYSATATNANEHVIALSTALRTASDQANQLVDQAAEAGDNVTADVCTEVTRDLDKWYWFVAAHQ